MNDFVGDDVMILDASLIVAKVVTKRKQAYELCSHFQESCPAKLPWMEDVVREDESLTQAKCIMCSKVEGRDKLLVVTIDRLWKHARRNKAEKDMYLRRRKMSTGECYFILNKDVFKNEFLYYWVKMLYHNELREQRN